MGNNLPPPGYDDASVIPEKRLQMQLNQLEAELNKIRSVFQQHLPGQFRSRAQFEKEFYALRHSAEELGEDYSFLVEKIITDYEDFQKGPDQSKLDKLFRDVKSLELLLIG